MIGSLLEEAFASSYGNRQGPKPSFLTESEQQGGQWSYIKTPLQGQLYLWFLKPP